MLRKVDKGASPKHRSFGALRSGGFRQLTADVIFSAGSLISPHLSFGQGKNIIVCDAAVNAAMQNIQNKLVETRCSPLLHGSFTIIYCYKLVRIERRTKSIEPSKY